jgi:hypothetical protein
LQNNSGNKEDLFGKIESLFDVKFAVSEHSRSFTIKDTKNNSRISLEIIPEPGENLIYLISVYTNNCHLQLQNCTKFIVSQMLEEVIFISEDKELLSGLIVSKQGDCALYSNVSKKTLTADFSQLNSEKLLSAVALSVTESVNE